jgi:hypothetical protein
MVIWATTGMSGSTSRAARTALADLLEVPEGLDDEQVRAAFLERRHLFRERAACLFMAGWPVGLEAHA